MVVEALTQGGFGARLRIVRVNGLDTEWGAADLEQISQAAPDAILVPKVNGAADISAARAKTSGLPIWAMMETAEGILNAAAIAKAEGMAGFVMGTNDLAKELGARSRAAMTTALQHCLLAARAAGIPCIDGVYNAFKDEEGLRAECEDGRDMGMDGKTLIHPAQIAITNAVFAPSEAEIELSRRQIEAFNACRGRGRGCRGRRRAHCREFACCDRTGDTGQGRGHRSNGASGMSWILLILGVALWSGAHLFRSVRPQGRAALQERFGAGSKGIMALLILISLGLMILGYRADTLRAGMDAARLGLTHLNNLLMILAFYMYAHHGDKTGHGLCVRQSQATRS